MNSNDFTKKNLHNLLAVWNMFQPSFEWHVENKQSKGVEMPIKIMY